MSVYKNAALCTSVLLTSMLFSHAVHANKGKRLKFNELTIDAQVKLTHPVFAADLIPEQGKELVVFGVDEKEQRWLMIYQFNEENQQYSILKKHSLPNNLHAFDITQPYQGQLQKLYFLTSNKLYQYQASEQPLAPALREVSDISTLSLNDKPQYMRRSRFTKDLNKDQLDDIILSDFSETHLLIAQQDNSFKQESLPIKPQIRSGNDSVTYSETKLYFADINFDKQPDVIRVGEGELEIYLQTEQGKFDTEPRYQKIDSEISGIDWWNKRGADGESLDQSNLVYKKIEELKDINHDGITDMVVRYTQSSGVLDRANDYEVYLGENRQGNLVFPDKPNSVISADGTLTGLEFVDIDNDEKSEVMLAGFDIGLTQIIGALMSGSIDQDVHVFKMDEQGRFDKRRKASKETELSFSLSSGTSGSPVVELADLNGDGFKDLLLSDGDDALKAYLGDNNTKMFARSNKKYKITLPKEGSMLTTEDINGDGKADILIKYGRQDDEELHNQFKVLLAE